MRHSIFLKFIAVFLCAASLLGAAGCALGIFAMSQMGLYGSTLEEAYAEATGNTVERLAHELAVRNASRELGGADDYLIRDYYGSHWMQSTFDWNQVGYTILDPEGNVLEQQELSGAYTDLIPYSFDVEGAQYLNVLNTMTEEEYNEIHYSPVETVPVTEPEPEPELTVYNMVPADGSKINAIHVDFADGYSSHYEGGGYLGVLTYFTADQLKFQAQSDYADTDRLFEDIADRTPVGMLFVDAQGQAVLEIRHPDYLIEEFCRDDANSYIVLRPLEESAQLTESIIYDAIPPEGQYVSTVSVTYSDGWCESAGGTPNIGFLGYDADGFVAFTANSPGILDYRTQSVTYISFHDEQGNLVYEASDPESVGGFSMEEDILIFRSRETTGEDAPPQVSDEGIYIYDDVPPGGYAVYRMELWLEGASRGIVIEATESYLGIADHDSSGNVIFTAENWQDFVFSKPANVVYILMESEDGRLLYEARQENIPTGSGCSIGTFAYSEDGALVFSRGNAAEARVTAEIEEPAADGQAEIPADMEKVVLEEIPVYFQPHENSQVADYLEAGASVEILEIQVLLGREWGKVYNGWILLAGNTSAEEVLSETTEAEEGTVPVATEEEPADITEPTMAEEASEAAAQETLPPETQETLDATEPSTAAETELSTEPTYDPDTVEETEAVPGIPLSTDPYEIALAEDTLRVYGYYDHARGENMIVEYTYETVPAYTVEIVMGPGALRNQYEWVLLEQIYRIRDYLVPVLILGLVLFAVTAVYLCCAAGRRPGVAEVRANGLNALPLDLYLCAAVGGVTLCALAMVEGGGELMRQDMQTGMLFSVLMAFGACLLVVGCCFAFAAQVKTPGGYWWRNSLCGRSVGIISWLWHKFLKLCAWLWDKYDEVLQPALVRLFKALWKLTKFFCIQLKDAFLWIWDKVIRICRWSCENLIRGWRWMTRILARFFSMLPLTWQFLLTGFLLVFLLYIMMRTYKVGYILLGFGIFFGVILYAASAFGILLENAKRMRKGDLDTKVDDKLLIGGFRDFAEELNGLADVAVVAAQKQLKSERMKTELITNVSHDIKTPLTSIINYVDLLEKPHSPEEQQAYLEVLSRQSQRLKKLIDDLMEMSKASTGNMAVEITRVNAAEAVNQALGEFADKLDKAQLIPVFRQPEQDIYMMADGRLVWRVLSNLLSNAVKYALPGTRVYIDLMELEGRVVLSLKNISRDSLNIHADELLERFVRGDAARNTEGSGLGLNIAQSLMELQKGKLELLVDGDLFKVTLIFPGT